jgi:hypothetical protein
LICPGWAIIPPLRDRIFELAIMLAERREVRYWID